MSCFTVCDEHIRVLVHAAAHPEQLDIDPRAMWVAQGNKVCYYPTDGQFHEVNDSNAAECYRYQACDAADWTGSEAERFTSDLIERMVSLTPQMQEIDLWEIGEDTAPQAVGVATR